MIEERSIAVAVCDACGHQDYANEKGKFWGGNGYAIILEEHRTDNTFRAYACRETHIGKAARAALDQWREQDAPWETAGGSPMPPDAPPLPEHNGDATAVTV